MVESKRRVWKNLNWSILCGSRFTNGHRLLLLLRGSSHVSWHISVDTRVMGISFPATCPMYRNVYRHMLQRCNRRKSTYSINNVRPWPLVGKLYEERVTTAHGVGPPPTGLSGYFTFLCTDFNLGFPINISTDESEGERIRVRQVWPEDATSSGHDVQQPAVTQDVDKRVDVLWNALVFNGTGSAGGYEKLQRRIPTEGHCLCSLPASISACPVGRAHVWENT